MITDPTGVGDGTAPARLLNMAEGGSKQTFNNRLAHHNPVWCAAMDPVDAEPSTPSTVIAASRSGAPLYKSGRTLHTGADLLTDNQPQQLAALFETTGMSQSKRPGPSTSG